MTTAAGCMVFGVGNDLHSDDGIGPFIAKTLKKQGFSAYNCATAPENFTSLVRRQHPDLLIIADAAMMGKEPGTVCRIPEDKIPDTAIGTHMLPLSHLVRFLQEDAGQVVVIGIQPASLDDGDELSPAVADAASRVIAAIAEGTVEQIPLL